MRFYKHPEQMTPGSVWKICGEDALEYLWYDFDSYYYHGALYGTTPWYWGAHSATIRIRSQANYDLFKLETNYFLTELTEEDTGLLHAKFLVGEDIAEVLLYKSLWDTVFELAHPTIDPKGKPRLKLMFGKYPIEYVQGLIAEQK